MGLPRWLQRLISCLAERVQRSAVGMIVSGYLLEAYANTYNDVSLDDYVRPAAAGPSGGA